MPASSMPTSSRTKPVSSTPASPKPSPARVKPDETRPEVVLRRIAEQGMDGRRCRGGGPRIGTPPSPARVKPDETRPEGGAAAEAQNVSEDSNAYLVAPDLDGACDGGWDLRCAGN